MQEHFVHHARIIPGAVLVVALVALAGCGQGIERPSPTPLLPQATTAATLRTTPPATPSPIATPRSTRTPTITVPTAPVLTAVPSPSPGLTAAPSLTSTQPLAAASGALGSSASIANATPASDAAASETSTGDSTKVDVRLVQSLDTVYYSVAGTTTQDIFDSVETNGPDSNAQKEGHITSGLTRSSASYRYQSIDHGESCELRDVEIELDLVVTLPRHSGLGTLSTPQLARWQEFAEEVRVHEQTHVDLYVQGIEAFEKRVKDQPREVSSCDVLESSIASAWEDEDALTGRKQEAFHQSEEQLSLELRGPVQQQIDDNEFVLADLEMGIASDSSEIQRLRVQIDGLDVAMKPFDDQLSAIRDEYPDVPLPSDTFDEYERLRAEWNRLNDQRNAEVVQLNALVNSHNRAAEEINRLAEETSRLIEELAWLP